MLGLACAVEPDDSGLSADWPHFGGDLGGLRYSPLAGIERDNVDELEIAWEHHSGDFSDGSDGGSYTSLSATPIVVDDTLYYCTGFHRVFALDPETGDLAPLSEALLFTAARAEMLRLEVAPAVGAGEVVMVERCYLSTLVYQGVARGLDLAMLRSVTEVAHAGLWPDRIFLLDVDAATRRSRASRRARADRIESRAENYHAKVAQGYLEVADERMEVIDARGSLETVQALLRERITTMLARDGVA